MPRGQHPNSRANLKPFTSDQSREKAVKNGKKGAKVREENKETREKEQPVIREIARQFLAEMASENPKWQTLAAKAGITTDLSVKELLVLVYMMNSTKKGNLDDIQKLATILGEDTTQDSEKRNNGILDDLAEYMKPKPETEAKRDAQS